MSGSRGRIGNDKGKGKVRETSPEQSSPNFVRRIVEYEDRTMKSHGKGILTKDALAKIKDVSSGSKRARDAESDLDKFGKLKKTNILQYKEPRKDTEKGDDKRRKYKKMEIQPKGDYPTLCTRSSPRCLFDAVRNMNNRQIKAVQEMGFGNVLNLNIKMKTY
ncbi:uncharacterized protein LOC131002967 [Salvia miltiorrhiza]|uniref:uncharacterized protein LOC131002967 n=1 Tax=Salvia miltiorrhiza TaxID=226208 RepID=UPI0025AC6A8A|nr:uncharacterized protein LOC131002967 [Salvia miltiorrhiza]